LGQNVKNLHLSGDDMGCKDFEHQHPYTPTPLHPYSHCVSPEVNEKYEAVNIMTGDSC
jgi:hypothetical protein